MFLSKFSSISMENQSMSNSNSMQLESNQTCVSIVLKCNQVNSSSSYEFNSIGGKTFSRVLSNSFNILAIANDRISETTRLNLQCLTEIFVMNKHSFVSFDLCHWINNEETKKVKPKPRSNRKICLPWRWTSAKLKSQKIDDLWQKTDIFKNRWKQQSKRYLSNFTCRWNKI